MDKENNMNCEADWVAAYYSHYIDLNNTLKFFTSIHTQLNAEAAEGSDSAVLLM